MLREWEAYHRLGTSCNRLDANRLSAIRSCNRYGASHVNLHSSRIRLGAYRIPFDNGERLFKRFHAELELAL